MQKIKIIRTARTRSEARTLTLLVWCFHWLRDSSGEPRDHYITVDAKDIAGFPDSNIKIMVPDGGQHLTRR